MEPEEYIFKRSHSQWTIAVQVAMILVLYVVLLYAVSACSALYSTELTKRNSTGLTDAVTWDSHSLFIQGQRVFILSAEIHPWRLPGNPDLWADILQKVKSNGFNTVSFYVNWAVHFPTPSTNNGKGDFQEGTYRDVQRFIDEAKKAGLWLIASITKIIAKNQITDGGPIILVQAENEFSTSTNNNIYMQAIIDLYRANGVVVPIIHNDQHAGQAGNFSPDRPGTHVDIYCGDSYPQGANKWTQVQAIYYSAHQNSAPSNPLCLAEFGGGYLLGWGGAALGGTGYEKFTNDLTDASYENIFYKDTYSQTTTILSIYSGCLEECKVPNRNNFLQLVLFGGTNWGQTVEPTVYSSYDYGGGINENRIATPKMNEMRLQGLFLRVSRDLLGATLLANGTNYTSSDQIHTAELRNWDNGAASTAITTTLLTVDTSLGRITIPKTGNITFNGRESKILVTDYVFGSTTTHILYSTAEIGATDYIVFYGPVGQLGETVFRFESAPTVSGPPTVQSTFASDMLTLSYSLLSGSQVVTVKNGNKTVVVIVLDKATANIWHAPVIAGKGNFGEFFSIGTNQSVLVSGPYIVRTAKISGSTLALTGDLNGTTPIEFVAPPDVHSLTWNGAPAPLTKSAQGLFTTTLKAKESGVTLPVLSKWKVLGSLPEVDLDFDDSSFVTADQTMTNYTDLPVLAGDRVLYSQQYGFYGGNLIWRGHFNASGLETAITTTVQYGFAGGYSAWLNGAFLGSSQGNATTTQGMDSIVETSTNGGKEPRGIRGFAIEGANTTFGTWKLQGNQGGAGSTPDAFRGYLNEGGLYAERIGAHLPGFSDSSWTEGTPLTGGGVFGAGVNFYRTTFNLNIPDGVDTPIRLSVTPSAKTSNFRVQIYLNGWQTSNFVCLARWNSTPQIYQYIGIVSLVAGRRRCIDRRSPDSI
ncbi:hypothetical protein H0H87_006075 [Tephrocybe sp. NHM501043]|nr:hypothetical protein H0H87_006075 [Tephrocybe sp. NHM501043]